jgi:site-specific recombinase XerC
LRHSGPHSSVGLTGNTANNRACLNNLTAYRLPDGDTLGAKPLGAITEDAIEAFFTVLRNDGKAASTINKYVQLCRVLFRWALKKRYLSHNPSIRPDKMAQRHRRLRPDVVDADGKPTRAGEERALLAVAGSHLQRLVIGSLETGLRLGELLRTSGAMLISKVGA